MKKTLRDRILDNLVKNKVGDRIDCDSFSDKSLSWIEIRIKDVSVTIGFDYKGENIEQIQGHKDVVEVVSQTKLF